MPAMRAKIKAWLSGHLAILVCLHWFIWDAATAVAYLDAAPPQLQRIENFLHMPIWIVWAVVSALLLFGALVPVRLGERFRELAIWTRGLGMVLSVILLALWGLEFIFSDAERGWVSGKNYLMLAVNGLFFGYVVSRYSVREG